MNGTNHGQWARVSGLAAIALVLAVSWGEAENGIELSEIGRGTFRAFASDSSTEPVAWIWVPGHAGPGVEVREFWIMRNTYQRPTVSPPKTATLVIKPVTDGTANNVNDYFDFRNWVLSDGKQAGTGVPASEFMAAYAHTVMPIPKDLAAPE